ncbi:MAG: hypothetical protein H7066_15215 [Cytophagaceae bacterium]|nr:hypothetical protein [Gemmatimonadaceae bacterium]
MTTPTAVGTWPRTTSTEWAFHPTAAWTPPWPWAVWIGGTGLTSVAGETYRRIRASIWSVFTRPFLGLALMGGGSRIS